MLRDCEEPRRRTGNPSARDYPEIVRRIMILAVAALAVSLLLPMAAGARVVPQKRIGKVRLGVSQPVLFDKLPEPKRVIRTTSFVSGLIIDIWEYNGLEIEFEDGNVVTAVRTTRVFERTRKGAGVGTPKALLRKLHPKIRCGKGAWTICSMGRPRKGGAKATSFELQSGRVTEISVYRVVVG